MTDVKSTQNNTNSPVEKKTHPVVKFARKVVLFFILAFVLALVGVYTYFNYTYSEGTHAGMLLKFSQNGYMFKTYEGEMNLGGINPLPGNTIANNIWKFSVKDDSVAKLLKDKEGDMLRLHYKEKVKNLPWQGETKYFVDGVEVIPK